MNESKKEKPDKKLATDHEFERRLPTFTLAHRELEIYGEGRGTLRDAY